MDALSTYKTQAAALMRSRIHHTWHGLQTFLTPLMYSDHHLHRTVGKKLLYSSAEDA